MNKEPNKPLHKLERKFLEIALSDTGQSKVEKLGFIPLKEDAWGSELAKLH